VIRVVLPSHLSILARVSGEVLLDVRDVITRSTVLDELETQYPMLRGTIRDQITLQRRPLVRFFACGLDITHDSPDANLPDAVENGTEPLLIVGAIAGG
jgi:sulfur-carrier protein